MFILKQSWLSVPKKPLHILVPHSIHDKYKRQTDLGMFLTYDLNSNEFTVIE